MFPLSMTHPVWVLQPSKFLNSKGLEILLLAVAAAPRPFGHVSGSPGMVDAV